MRFQRPPFVQQRPPFRKRRPEPQEDVGAESPDEELEDGLRREVGIFAPLGGCEKAGGSASADRRTLSGLRRILRPALIRLTRQDAPNLFIFKKDIKYLTEE